MSAIGANGQTNTFPDDGNVGIGTTSPAASLDVNGYTLSTKYLFRGEGGNSNAPHSHYAIYQESGAWVWPYPKLVINYHTGIKMVGHYAYGGIRFYTGYSPDATPTDAVMSIGDGDSNVRIGTSLFISTSMGIGTSNPGSYKLAVEGTIGARKVKVTNQPGWADFVFEEDYQLPSLYEVEQFIKTNKHLPGIPSATEVEKEGFDLADMDKRLLQKVEEQMLYIIELNKKVEQLTQKIEKLK